MTITEIIARCSCHAADDPETHDYHKQSLCSLDGELIIGFQEMQFDRLEHGEAVVARATVRSR